jgi:NitT/TauT family transport system permease protein
VFRLFPTGGKAHEPIDGRIRCDSGADGIVRMEEGKLCFQIIPVDFRWDRLKVFVYCPEEPFGAYVLIKSKSWLIILSLLLLLVAWQITVWFSGLPAFILPSPTQVGSRFIQAVLDGTLLRNSVVTLVEVLVGLVIGVSSATVLGYLLARSVHLERLLSPYIVASQSIPIVAIAPLLVIWFGPGLFSKVLICALIVFFPVLVNTIVGVRSVPEDLRDLMRSLQASRWQTLKDLEMPAALPVFLGGLKIGATLSVIGAVVGEFVGAKSGLGFLVNVGRGVYDTALVFVAVFTLIALALILYGLVSLLEKRLLWWQQRPENEVLLINELPAKTKTGEI